MFDNVQVRALGIGKAGVATIVAIWKMLDTI